MGKIRWVETPAVAESSRPEALGHSKINWDHNNIINIIGPHEDKWGRLVIRVFYLDEDK